MITTKDFNKVSDKVLKSIPEFKPTDIKRFEAINAIRKVRGKVKRNNSIYVQPTDTIWDEGHNSFVQIAAISSVQGNNPKFISIFFQGANASIITLYGNRATDRLVFAYLWLSNHNASKEGRDDSKMPLYKYIDEAKEAKRSLVSLTAKAGAMGVASTMSDKDAIEFSVSIGNPIHWNADQARKSLLDLADKDADKFLRLSKNQDKTTRATIQRAISQQVIKFNKVNHSWKFASTGTVFCSPPRGVDKVQGLIDFVLNTKNGPEIIKQISDMVQSDLTKTVKPSKK